jgi:hypothetical protein
MATGTISNLEEGGETTSRLNHQAGLGQDVTHGDRGPVKGLSYTGTLNSAGTELAGTYYAGRASRYRVTFQHAAIRTVAAAGHQTPPDPRAKTGSATLFDIRESHASVVPLLRGVAVSSASSVGRWLKTRPAPSHGRSARSALGIARVAGLPDVRDGGSCSRPFRHRLKDVPAF